MDNAADIQIRMMMIMIGMDFVCFSVFGFMCFYFNLTFLFGITKDALDQFLEFRQGSNHSVRAALNFDFKRPSFLSLTKCTLISLQFDCVEFSPIQCDKVRYSGNQSGRLSDRLFIAVPFTLILSLPQ